MRATPRQAAVAACVAALIGTAAAIAPAAATPAASTLPAAAAVPAAGSDTERTVVVLASDGASEAAVRAAVDAAGGTVTAANTDVGVYTVRTSAAGFDDAVRATAAVDGTATNRAIGKAPTSSPKSREVEKLTPQERAQASSDASAEHRPGRPSGGAAPGADPLSSLQWDMDMINAPQAHEISAGRGVRVGIMDTGVDASHPDIALNFNAALSRNFTIDDPSVDGACAEDPDGSCLDPADVDENGHGTHVAGTIAAPVNGVGIVGVAPQAEIVNLRAGQDSGYFFLQPTVDALTYAGRNGIDVVNMSFYIDPWLYNCANNPADSPQAQQEQRTIIAATNRALRFAKAHGVTLVAAAGNENTDLNNPTVDASSPDYPPGVAYERTVDNSCLTMPTEGDGVIAVSSIGPSFLKADYSNWGTQEITVAAPGGYYRDFFGTDRYASPTNLILAPMPKSVGIAEGSIDPGTGKSTTPFVVADCASGTCSYYQYLQGTSMAAPHATGVVALIVGRWGHRDWRLGGMALTPWVSERHLIRSAADHACPVPVYDYPDRDETYTSACEGPARDNGWYGDGVVDALAAVQRG